jgi:hypothetical protein
LAAKEANARAASVGRVIRDFEEDKKPHDLYCRKVDRWYRDYRAIPDERSKANDWHSKVFPPYAFQVVETLTANVVDPKPRWPVRPYPRMASLADRQLLIDGARANEILLQEQIANPREPFAMKQMAFAKQAFIANLSVFKTYWDYAERDVRRQAATVEIDQELGVPTVKLSTVTARRAVRDDPCVDVVDVRDWIPHQGAVSLERALRVTHRVWYSFDELKRLERQNVYGVNAGGDPVDKLKESKDFNAESSSREQELFSADRTKDKIEVLEQWRREPDGSLRVVAVGNRGVLLRDMPSPFNHDQFPFVTCTPIPDLGRIHGIGAVEQISDIQTATWSFINQRIDSTELMNNAIVLIREDVDDVDAFEWAPGAQWMVQDPAQVSLLQINPAPAEISLRAEELLKQDLQNIPGASPSLLGQVDPSAQTATEVSLTTSLAQRRVALMKQQFKWAFAGVGQQWMWLNQQFVTHPRLVERLGADGAAAWEEIHPLLLQGDFHIQLDQMDESLLRQERRAEAQAKLQVILGALGSLGALAQAGACPLPNVKRYVEDYLDAYDVLDKDAYWSVSPGPEQMPGQQAQAQPDPMGQGGVTSPHAYDANAPSNAVSMSPLAALQRMGAMSGGPVNA